MLYILTAYLLSVLEAVSRPVRELIHLSRISLWNLQMRPILKPGISPKRTYLYNVAFDNLRYLHASSRSKTSSIFIGFPSCDSFLHYKNTKGYLQQAKIAAAECCLVIFGR